MLSAMMSAWAAAAEAPVLLVDATAVRSTNLGWGGAAPDEFANAPLVVEDNAEPSSPYFAEFSVPAERKGKYEIWALVLGCGAHWVSPFTWSVDGGSAHDAAALPGSSEEGCPRWVKLGSVDLERGEHTVRFEVTGRRQQPDDAYIFSLWQWVLAPVEAGFAPWSPNVALSYNPQVNQNAGAAKASGASAVPYRRILGKTASPVTLTVRTKQSLPDVAPVWRDYSEGGVVTAPDFFIPELIRPLRPRFIRKDHCMPTGTLRADGGIDYDYTRLRNSVTAIRAVGAEPVIGLELQPATMPHDAAGNIPDRSVWLDDPGFEARWRQALNLAFDDLEAQGLVVNYFQCFNEPEYSGYNGHAKVAVWIYDIAQQVVRARRPDAKMMGIGCGDGISEVGMLFLDYLEKNPGAADYFDYHTYQASPEFYRNRLEWVRLELKRRGLEHVQPAVTEWGVTSSGASRHRGGMEAAIYNARVIKALAEGGAPIGCQFCLRDFPNEGLKFGLLTTEGGFKPAYWAQWLWARLPDGTGRVAVEGASEESIDAYACSDGEGGFWVLTWYGAPSDDWASRQVTLKFDGAVWPGMRLTEYVLDRESHIGWLPPGVPVEFPRRESFVRYEPARVPEISRLMRPNSMRLLHLQFASEPGDTIPRTLRNDPGLYGVMTP